MRKFQKLKFRMGTGPSWPTLKLVVVVMMNFVIDALLVLID
jgi:hypothetical protein